MQINILFQNANIGCLGIGIKEGMDFRGARKEISENDENICYLAMAMLSQKTTCILSYSNNLSNLLKFNFKYISKICKNYTKCRINLQ